MGRPVVHWEIAGKDAAKLSQFYTDLFDWQVKTVQEMGGYGLVETGGQGGINGGIMACPPGIPPYLTFYISVDDLQATLDKAERLDGKTIVPPTPIPNVGAFAMLHDPEGHLVGIFQEPSS